MSASIVLSYPTDFKINVRFIGFDSDFSNGFNYTFNRSYLIDLYKVIDRWLICSFLKKFPPEIRIRFAGIRWVDATTMQCLDLSGKDDNFNVQMQHLPGFRNGLKEIS